MASNRVPLSEESVRRLQRAYDEQRKDREERERRIRQDGSASDWSVSRAD